MLDQKHLPIDKVMECQWNSISYKKEKFRNVRKLTGNKAYKIITHEYETIVPEYRQRHFYTSMSLS